MCKLFLLLSATLGIGQCGIIFRFSDSLADLAEVGNWTQFFNSDNPFGEGLGDDERIDHIRKTLGTKCSQSVQCKDPIAMEVDFSNGHKKAFPDAQLSEALECLAISSDAKNPLKGFFCSNKDQRQKTQVKSCLESCEKNGMKNVYQEPIDEVNCSRCPDFEVRYFCLLDSIKVCQQDNKWNQEKKILRKLVDALKEE